MPSKLSNTNYETDNGQGGKKVKGFIKPTRYPVTIALPFSFFEDRATASHHTYTGNNPGWNDEVWIDRSGTTDHRPLLHGGSTQTVTPTVTLYDDINPNVPVEGNEDDHDMD